MTNSDTSFPKRNCWFSCRWHCSSLSCHWISCFLVVVQKFHCKTCKRVIKNSFFIFDSVWSLTFGGTTLFFISTERSFVLWVFCSFKERGLGEANILNSFWLDTEEVIVPSCLAVPYIGQTRTKVTQSSPWLLAGVSSVHFGARHCKYFIDFLTIVSPWKSMENTVSILTTIDCVTMEICETDPRSSVKAGGLVSNMKLHFRFNCVTFSISVALLLVSCITSSLLNY